MFDGQVFARLDAAALSYAPRSDHACFVSPENCNPDIKLKKKPTEYLNQLYFDALVFTPEALRHLVAQVGVVRVILGSDHPTPVEAASGRPCFPALDADQPAKGHDP